MWQVTELSKFCYCMASRDMLCTVDNLEKINTLYKLKVSELLF